MLPITISSPVTTYFVSTTYFVLPDLFRISDLFCNKIALFCITSPTYFIPIVDLICYKMVRRILTRFHGDKNNSIIQNV